MWSRASTLVGGALLIGLGVVLLAVNTFGMRLPFEFSSIGWPVFVIAPGIALLIIGLIASGEAGIGLAVAGGIVTTVGLILAYQSATSHWTSWAYAWALIAPTSVGASMFLWGVLHRRGDKDCPGLAWGSSSSPSASRSSRAFSTWAAPVASLRSDARRCQWL